MKIIVAGGTGFLGSVLSKSLAADHDVIVLTRSAPRDSQPKSNERISRAQWNPDGDAGPWAAAVDGAGAVINLAGESIGARRWTASEKARILDSRVLATRSLVEAVRKAARPPAVFVSGSAVGYYGARGDEMLTEQSPPGSDFLAQVCVAWETEALKASSAQTRVTIVRTGLALDRGAPALEKMAMPFKLFVGGPVGSGRQYVSWIHRADWVRLVISLLKSDAPSGAVNATAPTPVTNAEFSRALGRALGRPSWLPAPAPALRILLGEMADALLLSGQRVVPARAAGFGFRFQYEEVGAALGAIFGGT